MLGIFYIILSSLSHYFQIKSGYMRGGIHILFITLATCFLLSYMPAKTVILGKVVPADGGELVWVLGEKDSLKSVLIDGNFQFDVRPGIYKLVVDAKQPYKDVMLDNLVVRADETLDVGEIVLKQ